MKRPKGVEKTAVLVLEVEWSGLGKCDPLGARFRRNLDAFWTPDVTYAVMYTSSICKMFVVRDSGFTMAFLLGMC